LQKIHQALSQLSSTSTITFIKNIKAGFMRIENKPGYGRKLQQAKQIQITVNQKPIFAYEGELVSTILHCEGIRVFQRKHQTGKASGSYCNIGICCECLVKVIGDHNIRACQTPVADGMIISTDIEVQS
jgi:hypothetical protein